MYTSQQCILGQGKLVMVFVQLTLWNSCITMITIRQKLQYMILKFILNINLRMSRLPRVFCPISLMWDMDTGKILFILSKVKHKQFDCSLWVNRKSIEKMSISFNIIRMISDSFVSIMNLKWRECFYLQLIRFCFYRTMSMERRKGSSKVLYKEALAQGQRLIHFTVFLTGKASLSYTCSF